MLWSVRRGRFKQGGAELVLAVLWLAATVLAAIGRLVSPEALLFDTLAFGGVVLTLRHPRAGMALMISTLVGSALLVDPSGYAFTWVQSLIGVITLIRLNRLLGAGVQTVFALAAIAWVSVHVTEDPEPVSIVASVVILCALAWAIGWGFRSRAALDDAMKHSQRQHERLDLATDLHDFVARDLTLISMRAEAAIARGGATVEELREIAEHSRAANQFLRETAMKLDGDRQRPPRPSLTIDSVLASGRRDLELMGRGLRVEGRPPSRSHVVDAVAGRLLLEALHNATKHGMGDVTVRFHDERSRFRVEVANITTRAPSARGPSLGVMAMRHRARVFGGDLTSRLHGDVWLCSFTLPQTE